jgi:hypothetical protein
VANEQKALDREQIFYFNDSVTNALTLPEALGGTSSQYPIYDASGHRRLVGMFASSQTPAAGYPRVRFYDSPDNGTVRATYVFDKDTTTSTQNVYKIDIPLYTPWFTIEWTMGASTANVFGVAWVYPEDGGPDYPGGSNSAASRPSTYRTVIAGLATPGGNGQFLEIRNPAASGRVIRVTMQALLKPSATILWTVKKQSALSTGGTSADNTPVPLDSQNAATVAVVRQYTVAPTAGAAVGSVWADPAVTAGDRLVDQPGELEITQPITLRAGESVGWFSDAVATVYAVVELTDSGN